MSVFSFVCSCLVARGFIPASNRMSVGLKTMNRNFNLLHPLVDSICDCENVRVYATKRVFGPLLSLYILSNIILNPSSRPPPPPRCVYLEPFPVFNPDHSSHVALFTHQHRNNTIHLRHNSCGQIKGKAVNYIPILYMLRRTIHNRKRGNLFSQNAEIETKMLTSTCK